jgi:hypothetical protein
MRKFITGAALAVALTLQGCGEQKSDGDPAAAAQSGETDLAKALDDKDDLSTLSDALKTTGLNGIFANAGSYTLIAPTDAAFAQLGDKAKALDSDQGSAALTTVVTTLGSTELEFAQTDGAITVTAEDGTKGRLAGDPVAAGPSIALPVDTVLKQL